MWTSDTRLFIGQSYVGKARFWIKSRRTADVVVRVGLTLTLGISTFSRISP